MQMVSCPVNYQQFSTVLSSSACTRIQHQTGRRPLSSIFDAFVGEFLVEVISHRGAESPCQQSSIGLSGSAYICTLRQEGRRPLVNSLRLICRVLPCVCIQRQTGRRPLLNLFLLLSFAGVVFAQHLRSISNMSTHSTMFCFNGNFNTILPSVTNKF